jgi:hypothetical protein
MRSRQGKTISLAALRLLSVVVAAGILGEAEAQPAAPANSSKTLTSTSAAKSGRGRPSSSPDVSVRRRRGGPESNRPSDANATPEGQNDLIKVLQPGSGQKTK